jgi:hypothetical protein
MREVYGSGMAGLERMCVIVVVVDALRSRCLEFGTGRTRRGRRNQAASDVPRGLRSYRTGELEIGLSRFGDVDSVLCYRILLRVSFSQVHDKSYHVGE